jgi:hypothetical protein
MLGRVHEGVLPMPHRPWAIALLAVIAAAPVAAQDAGVCRENAYQGRPVNPGTSERWQMQFAGRDPSLMAALAGRWYSETQANVGGQIMVNRQVQTFDASGAYGYEDQTCSVSYPQMPCSSNQGYGRWAALRQADGSVYVARNVSDLNRQDECTGFSAWMQGPGLLIETTTGGAMQRIP